MSEKSPVDVLLDRLDALREKATQSEWIHVPEDNAIYTSGSKGLIGVTFRSAYVSTEERDANAGLVTALVNAYPQLREAARQVAQPGRARAIEECATGLLREMMTKVRYESGSDDPMAPFAYDASWQAIAERVDALLALPSEPAETGDALDAKRYRWLRDESLNFDPGAGKESPWPVIGINGTDCYPISHGDLDAAIDAAMLAVADRSEREG